VLTFLLLCHRMKLLNEKVGVSMAVKVKVKKKDTVSCCDSASGCCGATPKPIERKEKFIIGFYKDIPKVATTLSSHDKLGEVKVRFGMNRMNYTVLPGLYCVGEPNETSPVLVTANYKLSFDKLREQLKNTNAYILVLDTKGVNVWCAAGKGTFGTKELSLRIKNENLSSIVSHKTVIVPQLGATGVSAFEITKQTGFKVIYGPIRAKDTEKFIEQGFKATEEMRRVNFTFVDRLVLTPIEFIPAFKNIIILFGILFILNTIGIGNFGQIDLFAFLGAIFIGSVFTPVLLPLIPFRAFSLKGFVLGMIWVLALMVLTPLSLLKLLAFFYLLPSISSYLSLQFTGCSTYTSPSGVNKEMQIALPLMLVFGVIGSILLLADMILGVIK
jgi:hypothetical protein